MYNKRRFQKINDKKVLHKVGKHWITVSIALLGLLGGGLTVSKFTARANSINDNNPNNVNNSLHVAHQNMNEPRIVTNQNRQNLNRPNNLSNSSHNISVTDVQRQSTHLYSRIYRNAINNENHARISNGSVSGRKFEKGPKSSNVRQTNNLTVNKEPVRKIKSVNNLKTNQYGNYHQYAISRVTLPFNRIRINKELQLHRNFNFQDKNPQVAKVGWVLNVLRSFKEYGHYRNYLRYEVRVDRKPFFITGNNKYVSFVAPTKRYTYYQKQLRRILAHTKNNQFNNVAKQLRKLIRHHSHNYRRYMRLYVKAYGIRQGVRHPIRVNYHSPIVKKESAPVSKQPQSLSSSNLTSASASVSNQPQFSSVSFSINTVPMSYNDQTQLSSMSMMPQSMSDSSRATRPQSSSAAQKSQSASASSSSESKVSSASVSSKAAPSSKASRPQSSSAAQKSQSASASSSSESKVSSASVSSKAAPSSKASRPQSASVAQKSQSVSASSSSKSKVSSASVSSKAAPSSKANLPKSSSASNKSSHKKSASSNVTPKKIVETVKYLDQSNEYKQISTQTFNDNKGVMETLQVPTGYHLASTATRLANNGSTQSVNVLPNSATVEYQNAGEKVSDKTVANGSVPAGKTSFSYGSLVAPVNYHLKNVSSNVTLHYGHTSDVPVLPNSAYVQYYDQSTGHNVDTANKYTDGHATAGKQQFDQSLTAPNNYRLENADQSHVSLSYGQALRVPLVLQAATNIVYQDQSNGHHQVGTQNFNGDKGTMEILNVPNSYHLAIASARVANNGGTQSVNVLPNSAYVQYYDQSTGHNVGIVNKYTDDHANAGKQQFNQNLTAPNNYRLKNSDQNHVSLNYGQTLRVPLVLQAATDVVYQDQSNGQHQVGTQNLNGDKGTMETLRVPTGYHLANTATRLANNGGTQSINVLPDVAYVQYYDQSTGHNVGVVNKYTDDHANAGKQQFNQNLTAPNNYGLANASQATIPLNYGSTIRVPVLVTYDGMTYKVLPGNKIEFTGGTMSNSPSFGERSNAPEVIKNASSIVFDNGVDTSHVTNMRQMFNNNSNLVNLDLSHLDTSHVTNMMGMFADDSNLVNLDLSHLNTGHVTNMMGMFYGDNHINHLDLSHLDTNHVTNMNGMFNNMSRLNSLTLGPNFVINSNYQPYFMFSSTNSLQTITIASPATKFNKSLFTFTMYKEIGGHDSQGRPYTLSTANDFSQGNDVGTFTSVRNPAPTDTDTIHLVGVDLPDEIKRGLQGTQSSVTAPSGYHFVNGSNGVFIFNGGKHQFDVAPNKSI